MYNRPMGLRKEAAMGDAFGDALRDLRQRAGLSLAGLAKRVPYSKEMIAKVETGERRPTPEMAQVCDRALGTAPLLAILCEHGGDDVDRRRALVTSLGLVATGAVAGFEGLAEVIRHGLNRAAGADDWDALVAAYARGLVTAPTAAYGPRLLADLNLLLQLVRDGQAGADQMRAAAGLGNFFGLWCGNRGQLDDAHRWYRTAGHLADRSGDTALAGYIRGRTAARGTYEGATIADTEAAVARVLAEAAQASIAGLEAYSAEAHIGALTGDYARAKAAARSMAAIAEALPDDADPWSMAAPMQRAMFVDAYIEGRTGTLETAAPSMQAALPALTGWPTWQAEVHQYWARALVAAGDVGAGIRYGLDAARSTAYADVRVIGMAVRDVVDAVPAGYRSDELDELRGYAAADPGPWETIR
jgi:transcriptional regulator with XRE-family HTH domain